MSQLPAKVEDVEYCDMLPSQATLYTSLVNKFSRQVRKQCQQIMPPPQLGVGCMQFFSLSKVNSVSSANLVQSLCLNPFYSATYLDNY